MAIYQERKQSLKSVTFFSQEGNPVVFDAHGYPHVQIEVEPGVYLPPPSIIIDYNLYGTPIYSPEIEGLENIATPYPLPTWQFSKAVSLYQDQKLILLDVIGGDKPITIDAFGYPHMMIRVAKGVYIAPPGLIMEHNIFGTPFYSTETITR